MFLYRPARESFPEDATEYEAGKVTQHFEHLRRLQLDGHLLLAGRTMTSAPLGIAVIRFSGFEAAEKFASEDPAVEAGVFKVEVLPFRTALLHEFLVAQREMEAEIERKRVLGF